MRSIDEWVYLHKERGFSYGKIADHFGVTRSVVAGVIWRAKLPKKPREPKTHFKCGHEASPENTYGPYPGNPRYCRACHLKRTTQYYRNRRETVIAVRGRA